MAKIALSISLIKENVTLLENILKDVETPSCLIEDVGTLYFKDSHNNDAHRIKTFFGDKLPAEDGEEGRKPILFTANVQAVLLITRQIGGVERRFLVTFGYGKNLIKTDCIQDKFGMYVVLNSIAPNTVRSVDVNILESVPKHDRIQSTKLSKMNTFNLNPERDLLRALTGKTKDAYQDMLGESVTGADTLKIAIDINVNQLPVRLEAIYNIYKLEDYKANFGFIDKISPIKDTTLRNTLNTEVLRKLNENELDLVWLSIPELVNWEEIQTIRYTPKGDDYYDLEVKTLLSDVYLDESVNLELLNTKRVYAFNNLGINIDSWSVYRCLCAEVENGGKQYILTNGQWYLIEDLFAQEVNTFYESVELSDLHLEESRLNEDEGSYNERVANLDRDHRLVMDKRLVKPSEGQEPIEFCDIYTTNKELVHVKRYSGSATLSHLFNQGLVSGELLIQQDFRTRLNAELDEIGRDKEHRILKAWEVEQNDRDFDRGDYKVIYAIITDSEGERPSIPFFSKVAFRHVCRRLQDYGYNVYLMKIGVNQEDDAKPELTTKRNERKRKAKEKREAAAVTEVAVVENAE